MQKNKRKENPNLEGENMCHFSLFSDLNFVVGINNLAAHLGSLFYYCHSTENAIMLSSDELPPKKLKEGVKPVVISRYVLRKINSVFLS